MMPFRCGKILPPRGSPEREFADQSALLLDFQAQGAIAPRVDDIDARSQDGKGDSLRRERAPRCAALSIPAARPLVMTRPACGEIFGEFMRRIPALGGGIAAADDGQLRIVQGVHVAGDIQRQRRTRRCAQQGRIARVREGHDMMAWNLPAMRVPQGSRPPRSSTGIRAPRREFRPLRARRRTPARCLGRSEATRSALERAGISSAGARVSVAQAEDSSLGSIGWIIGRAPRRSPSKSRWERADLPGCVALMDA